MTVKAYGPDGSSSGADGRSGDGSLGRKRHRERDVVVRFRPGDGRLKTPCEAGLLLRLGNSDFCLGPRIVQLDPQIQLSDPLIPAGRLGYAGLSQDLSLGRAPALQHGSRHGLGRPSGTALSKGGW
ncbi:MAG TPA: hypothetical protein VM422_03380 [Amaricoccus sp.]|nr:hypothetical protein [Amaricoccus sp.]